MDTINRPTFPAEWQKLVDQAANALRELALNEVAKTKFCSDPVLRPYMQRIADRYVAGKTIDDVLQRITQIQARGHAASAEYMGENCRDEEKANEATDVFIALVNAIGARNLNCSISLDLSHIGSLVDPELGYRNACRIANAAITFDKELMLSMEGSERADTIYATYSRIHSEANLANVGITIPAKLHRSLQDLPKLMAYPGRIRLVKGAFFEPEHISLTRNTTELTNRYVQLGMELLGSGHKCSIATHDHLIQEKLVKFIEQHGIDLKQLEFESLIGLGTEQIDGLQQRGLPTREYAVFGEEYFLYVLNRISEEPVRVYQAIVDVMQKTL